MPEQSPEQLAERWSQWLIFHRMVITYQLPGVWVRRREETPAEVSPAEVPSDVNCDGS